jgi:hypothetical protein
LREFAFAVAIGSKADSMFGLREAVEDGGFMSYGEDLNDLGRNSA